MHSTRIISNRVMAELERFMSEPRLILERGPLLGSPAGLRLSPKFSSTTATCPRLGPILTPGHAVVQQDLQRPVYIDLNNCHHEAFPRLQAQSLSG